MYKISQKHHHEYERIDIHIWTSLYVYFKITIKKRETLIDYPVYRRNTKLGVKIAIRCERRSLHVCRCIEADIIGRGLSDLDVAFIILHPDISL